MKYRAIKLDYDYIQGKCYIISAIQVKKWYGWVTILYVEGEASYVDDKVKKFLQELEHA